MEREGNINVWRKHRSVCLSHTPKKGPGLQHRFRPWLRIKLATFWFVRWGPTHWATPVRAWFCFLLWLNNIPLYIYMTFSLSIYLLTETELVCPSWVLWMLLQWARGCGYVFEVAVSFPSDIYPDIYPEARLQDLMVVLFLTFWQISMTVFHSGPTNLYSH